MFIGCWKAHIQKHFVQSGHCLGKANITICLFQAIDINLNEIYCNICGDYVYDNDFNSVNKQERTNALVTKQRLTGTVNNSTSITI